MIISANLVVELVDPEVRVVVDVEGKDEDEAIQDEHNDEDGPPYTLVLADDTVPSRRGVNDFWLPDRDDDEDEKHTNIVY